MEFVNPRQIRRVDFFDDSHLDGIPWIRRWFGDRRYLVIAVGDNASQDKLDEYRSIYPEAVIVRSAEDKAFKAIGAE